MFSSLEVRHFRMPRGWRRRWRWRHFNWRQGHGRRHGGSDV